MCGRRIAAFAPAPRATARRDQHFLRDVGLAFHADHFRDALAFDRQRFEEAQIRRTHRLARRRAIMDLRGLHAASGAADG